MSIKSAKFITYLCASTHETDRLWTVERPLIYYSSLIDKIIWVPAGFQTDLASVPRIPLIYLLWGGCAHHEGVLHDYLYRIDSTPIVERKVADKIFLESMIAREKPLRVRYPMYLGVRIGGWPAYHRLNTKHKFYS